MIVPPKEKVAAVAAPLSAAPPSGALIVAGGSLEPLEPQPIARMKKSRNVAAVSANTNLIINAKVTRVSIIGGSDSEAKRRPGTIVARALRQSYTSVMGAWGGGAFQNDSALDWLSELQARGEAGLRRVLSSVANTAPGDCVDVDDGAAAIAAAEIVAATLSHGRDRLTKEGRSWFDANAAKIGPEDLALARRAVERVLAGGSELRALWDESGRETEWHADVRVLLVRLGGDASVVAPLVNETTQEERRTEGGVDEQSKQALLTFLMMRGLEVTEEQETRIWDSHDPAEIRRWLARVVDATSVAALLDQ